MLPVKKLRPTACFGNFSKWPPVENENCNILVCGTARDLISKTEYIYPYLKGQGIQ